jgi:hypothetical protein
MNKKELFKIIKYVGLAIFLLGCGLQVVVGTLDLFFLDLSCCCLLAPSIVMLFSVAVSAVAQLVEKL